MTIAAAHAGRNAGVTVAEVNLKLIWDVVSQIKVGVRGHAYVVDVQGRLIAHPDISLVLRNTDMSQLAQVRAASGNVAGTTSEPVQMAQNIQGHRVLTASARVMPLGWLVFVELPIESQDAEDKGGYAKAQDESFYRRQREMMLKVVAGSDVVVTTALIPGRPAPKLITTEMVEAMSPGSVVVDLAAERGGNCELTRPDETVVHHGVTIIGPSNPAALVPYHASQMYSKNIVTFLGHLIREGVWNINVEDEITRETLVTQDGHVLNMKVRALLGLGELPPAYERRLELELE